MVVPSNKLFFFPSDHNNWPDAHDWEYSPEDSEEKSPKSKL